jgi:uncharacterized membrane protein (UPF0182 family)
MRPGSKMRARRPTGPSRRGVVLLVAFALLVMLLLSLRGIAGVYTDYLWFRSLYLGGVWKSILTAKVLLTAIFFAAFFVVLFVNLWIADRLAPSFRPPGPEEELLERYHQIVGKHGRLVRVGISAAFALIASSSVSSQWNDWVLFTHAKDFGITDPQFGMDIGFYVFRLPFLSYVVNWTFAALVTILLVTAAQHYVNGGIRARSFGERVTPQVKGHLSVLLAVLALVKAGDYWLQRYELTTSARGVVDGANYTDVKAQLPAIYLLLFISLFSIALLVFNIWRRGWVLPAVTVGLWAFVAVVVGGIYPQFIQRFRVEPAESRREQLYIERNIAATRDAFNITPGSDIQVQPINYSPTISDSDLIANAENVRDIRLLDPLEAYSAVNELQKQRNFYRFPGNTLDVDRYMIDGRQEQVIIGARVVDPSTQSSWERRHIAFTHGIGVAIAYADQVNDEGLPQYLLNEVPPGSSVPGLDLTLPQIYFGEGLDGYAIVGATRDEVDYINKQDQEVQYRYTGGGGVEMGSFFRRAMFALRFGQIEPLISNYITSESRILYVRDVGDRVREVAPFIKWDSNPYPVVAGGRIVYIVDGYTTTNRYPNAQRADTTGVSGNSGLRGASFNYVRNSVKAVVDAYEGSVRLYIVDGEDPIAAAYSDAFPDLFAERSELPADLVSHLRYPEDLFKVQTEMWSRYHVDDPGAFYSKSRWWEVARNPGREVLRQSDNGSSTRRDAGPVEPYYYQVRLPGETDPTFALMRPFVPFAENIETQPGQVVAPTDRTQTMTAFMVARSDPDQYGKLTVYEMPANTPPAGPAIVAARIATTSEIAQQLTLLNQEGSTIRYGDLLTYPLGNKLLYVRPLYVTNEGTRVPAMTKVIVAYGAQAERIAMGDSLRDALSQLFGSSAVNAVLGQEGSGGGTPPPTTAPGGGAPATPGTPLDPGVQRVLADIQRVFDEAEVARLRGDIKTWVEKQDQVRDLVRQLNNALA